MTLSSYNNTPSRLPRYLLIGLFATTTHYITALLLSFLLPILTATLMGALLGTVVSFQGNKRWTFVKETEQPNAHQWLRFSVTALVYNLGNLALMALLLNFVRLNPWLLQMVTTVTLTLITFQINQHWTFRHEPIKT